MVDLNVVLNGVVLFWTLWYAVRLHMAFCAGEVRNKHILCFTVPATVLAVLCGWLVCGGGG